MLNQTHNLRAGKYIRKYQRYESLRFEDTFRHFQMLKH